MKNKKTAKPKQPTLEQWKQLYEVGINLRNLAPWRALRDMNIFLVDLPGREEHLYCSVMGNGGENYAISIYPGNEAFWRLSRIMEGAAPPPLLMMEQDCLLCNFGDREEIEPPDRKIMKELNIRFRGHNQWVYFRAMKPGQLPWFLTGEQAQLLIDALQNVFMLCKYYMQEELKPDFEAGETLLRFYNAEQDMWFNTVVPMPPVSRPHYSMTLQDELLLARLKQKKKNKAVLEADWFHLPIPVQESKDQPPFAPHMTLFMDRAAGLPVAQHIAEKGEEPLTVPPSLLVEYVQDHGRPSAIYTRCEEYASLLENTCKALGIRLISGKEMTAVDTFVMELMMSMMGGFDLDDLDFDDFDFLE